MMERGPNKPAVGYWLPAEFMNVYKAWQWQGPVIRFQVWAPTNLSYQLPEPNPPGVTTFGDGVVTIWDVPTPISAQFVYYLTRGGLRQDSLGPVNNPADQNKADGQ